MAEELGGQEEERQGETTQQDCTSESATDLGKRQVRVVLLSVGFSSFPNLIATRVEAVLFFFRKKGSL